MSASGFMALVSSAYLLLAWPGGPTDISYVWRFLGISLLPVVFALSFWLAGRIRNVWLRRSSRTLASLMLVPSVLFLLLSSFSEAGCKRRIAPDLSPDGSHIVLIEIIPGGALSEDFAHIYMRRQWSPFSINIYAGEGQWDFRNNRVLNPQVQ
jgi:hypothetical protein